MQDHLTATQKFAGHLVVAENKVFSDDTGFSMHVKEQRLGDVNMVWGGYSNPVEQRMTFQQDKESVVCHFQLQGADMPTSKIGLREKQFLVFRESVQAHELRIPATTKVPRLFFELVMGNNFFDSLVRQESQFLREFDAYRSVNTLSSDFIADMTPAMYDIINQMQHAPYNGSLKSLFLEAKVIELFLMLVGQLDKNDKAFGTLPLSKADIPKLYDVKDYIERHFSADLSIVALAKAAGMNQTKLKAGFKSLFKTTVFGYINDLRLAAAKRLLLDGGMYVHEVAYQVGFAYPHYFSAAFKKKFGLSPTALTGAKKGIQL